MRTIQLLALCAVPLLACRGKDAPGDGFIVFHVSARPAGAASDTSPPSDVVALGPDTIFLSRVRMVLADLAIAPARAGECEEAEGEDLPPCIEFDMHPVVIDLPLDRPVASRATMPAPAGAYNLLQVILHKPTPATDTAFLAANPDFTGVSILVAGTLSRSGRRRLFTFASDFTEKEEIAITPPVHVPPGDSLHVTLRIDAASWFKGGDGKTLIDPRSAGPGGPNEHLVRDHIRTSLTVFRDQNRDGQEDGAAP